MVIEDALPAGICRLCSESVLAAIHFRQLCLDSMRQWTQTATFLCDIQPLTDEDKVLYLFYNHDERVVIADRTDTAPNVGKALKRINARFVEEVEEKVVLERKPEIRYGPKKWWCPDCHKKFSIYNKLNNHLRTSSKRACQECGLVMNKTKLGFHMANFHNKTVFPCTICHEVYNDMATLKTHKTKTHSKDMHPYTCKSCGLSFDKERALSVHSYSHSIFHCHCGKLFENRKCHVHHEKLCKKARPETRPIDYICDHCGNTYQKKPSLRIHIIQKHLNVLPYVCETCGKRTSTIGHLKSHEKTHTIERQTYECHCGAKLRTEIGYQLHLRIHTGEKPYECADCGEKFLSASRRLDHIKRRHRSSRDMPHGCKMCPARFVRPFELRKHCVSVHRF